MSTIKAAPRAGTPETEAAPARRRPLVLGLVLALVAAGAAYWFLLRPGGATEPEPGEVMTMEPIQVNLAGGHYLKIGIALQLTADAHDVDGSPALDATIELFSGLPLDQVSLPQQRRELKAQLAENLEEAYSGDVMEVYFTEFVTQ